MADSTSWWRRNRIWLIVLVPLLLAALAASSFRLVRLYLPNEWSRPQQVQGSAGTFEQRFMGTDGVWRTRNVSVSVVDLVSLPSGNGMIAAPGSQLWQLILAFEAAPDQFLAGCEIELADASGNRYDRNSGLLTERGQVAFFDSTDCVPEDAPGPKFDVLGVLEPEVPRPEMWMIDTVAALPAGVEPTQVIIKWSKPAYLVLDTAD